MLEREQRKLDILRGAKVNWTHRDWEDDRPMRFQRWERIVEKTHRDQKRYGTDRSERMFRKYQKDEPVSTEIIAGKNYTPKELDDIASQILRDDSKAERCRECGKPGEPTGATASVPEGIADREGNELALQFEEFKCENGHVWYPGEGKPRGIDGDNPILFKEHFDSRKRREIYTSVGTPDPSIVQGMYNRVHPQGRKVNSEEQRKRNGASFYR